MDESAITVRYAKALFSLAKENQWLSSLKEDAELISAICSRSEDFNILLNDPVILPSEKIRMMGLIFEKKVHKTTLDFLTLVTRNKRETYLPSISRYIQTLIRKEKNIKTAVITTAQELDENLLQKTQKILEKELKATVELSQRVNPEIIGGLILRIDDQQYDASVHTQLRKLKKSLLNHS